MQGARHTLPARSHRGLQAPAAVPWQRLGPESASDTAALLGVPAAHWPSPAPAPAPLAWSSCAGRVGILCDWGVTCIWG